MLSYERFAPAMNVPKAADRDVAAPSPRKWHAGGLRYPLDDPGEVLRPNMGDVLLPCEEQPAVRRFSLGTLLGHAAGLARLEVEHEWHWHRGVASARCLYPTEIHVGMTDRAGGSIEAGLYYYDPYDHALIRVGDSDAVATATAAFDIRRPAGVVFLVSSVIGRTAHVYGDFAYRLCCHEAGLMMQNLRMSARSLAFTPELYWLWESPMLEKALPIEPAQELLMGAMFLPNAKPADSTRCHAGGSRKAVDASAESRLDQQWYRQAARFHRAQLVDRAGIDGLRRRERSVPPEGRKTVIAAPVPDSDVRHFWRSRRSGDEPLLSGHALQVNETVLDCLPGVMQATCAAQGWPRFEIDKPVCLHVLNRGANRAWEVLKVGPGGCSRPVSTPRGWRVQDSYAQWNVNLDSASLGCVLVADYNAALSRYGNAAYRMVNAWAGCLAHAITGALHGHELFVRCLDGLVEEHLDTALGLQESEQAVFLLAVFGKGCGGRRFSLPYFRNTGFP